MRYDSLAVPNGAPFNKGPTDFPPERHAVPWAVGRFALKFCRIDADGRIRIKEGDIGLCTDREGACWEIQDFGGSVGHAPNEVAERAPS
jgi:hypothetical protein